MSEAAPAPQTPNQLPIPTGITSEVGSVALGPLLTIDKMLERGADRRLENIGAPAGTPEQRSGEDRRTVDKTYPMQPGRGLDKFAKFIDRSRAAEKA